ncbi:MAG: hypothetical protein QOE40_2392, partial [Actinomycetota bacterium]|nr:hypothetical protein [Actinomycetota bacterium]
MKLEGSLDAFSLPDIFQLLSFTKKTGGLHLASDGSDGAVFFAGGQVTGASADSSRQPLARRLIGAGVVDDDALSAAVDRASQGGSVGIAKALLEQQAIAADLLKQAANDQAVDAVFDLLRWRVGDFVFVVDEPNPDEVDVALSVESVLADVESRSDTWESASQVVPSPKAVLAMPVVLPADPSVSREEWSLLALVDGRRTVGELVDLTGSGQYAVVSTLAGLVTRGLLEVRSEGDDSADHVGVVVRRHGLLGPLEGAPFTPVVERAPDDLSELVNAPKGERDHGVVGGIAGDLAEVPAPAAESSGAVSGSEDPSLVTASAGDTAQMLGGAHVPGDVVPPRPEPFLPTRQADFDETPSPATRPMSMLTALDA